MKHVARWVALGVAVVVAAFAVVLATQVSSEPRAVTSNVLDKKVPDLSLPRFDKAGALTNADFAGKVVIVNFWNSWCIPCQDELPALQTFYKRHASEADFLMVGVLRDDGLGRARAYARAQGMDWRLVEDPDSEASLAFGVTGQPETYAIGANGIVAASLPAPASVKALEQMLAAARSVS
jgi:cytochrome c biogenesis protein CcmG, thiol:disulfide interchange protein DsbE